MLTQAKLKELLHYNPNTGIFTWLSYGKGINNLLAGTDKGNGYLQISVNRKRYLSHRLAWLYVYGEFPKLQIDHVNRIRNDNRIENLRISNQSQNMQNMSISAKNRSGVKGVSFYARDKKWDARMQISGKLHYLGRYDSIEEAAEVVKEKAKSLSLTFYYNTAQTFK